ncbi:MAG: heavy-metal-associated domain-containing protein [Pisciglobus halotolerans]|nr:heavy-metal-associated domain-containing protein [Pisciglobus halotolerans]
MEKVLFQIGFLECVGCARKIENKVSELKGIEAIKVFPKLGKIRIVFDSNQVTSQQIEATILLVGYPVYKKITA